MLQKLKNEARQTTKSGTGNEDLIEVMGYSLSWMHRPCRATQETGTREKTVATTDVESRQS